MKLTVVYDNEAKSELQSSWGFACLIETGECNILFDTGWDGHTLMENMEKLSIDPGSIDILVLSHQHWDHVGGATTFLNKDPDVDIYVPAAFSENLKKEMAERSKGHLHEVRGPREICRKVSTTGELGTGIKEQSLILELEEGYVVITGCAHPGLEAIIRAASGKGKVIGIIGGLHDSQEYELFRGMHLIGAGHCTAHKDVIREKYPETFVGIYAGYSVEL